MRKKIIYGLVIAIILVLGYLNYFAEDKKIENLEPVIETTDVTYKNEDYEVEAKEQKDYVNKKETGFTYAKAKLNEMLISGDNVFIDKLRNLILKHNIIGISENGWTFKTEEAKYDKEKDEIHIETGVEAENKERKIKVKAQNFKTDSKMSYINLSKDVVLENDKIAILADNGEYLDKNKIINLNGNIKLEGRGENVGLISGKFTDLNYNLDTKKIYATKDFDIKYKDVKIRAKNMTLDEGNESLYISNDVRIKIQGFDISLDNIYKAPNSDIINFVGKIKGKSKDYNFIADSGIYNVKTKIFEIYGDVIAYSKTNEKLVADRLIYDTNLENLVILAKDNIKYYSKDGILETKKLDYDLKTKIAKTNGKYEFIGSRYTSYGKDLEYNDITKIIKIEDGFIKDSKKHQELEAQEITFNKENNSSKLLGDAKLRNNKYFVKSPKIIYDSKTKILDVPENYEITFLKEKMTLIGKKASYNEVNYDFISNGEIKIKGQNYVADGKDLEYNNKTKIGKLNGSAKIFLQSRKIYITGNNIDFKNNDFVRFSKGIEFTTPKYMGTSEIAKYKFEEDTIYIPKEIRISSKDKEYYGTIGKGKYIIKKDVFIGEKLDLSSKDKKNVTSDNFKYYSKLNKVELLENTILKTTDYKIKTNNMDYYTKEEKCVLIGNYQIYYANYTLESNDGIINNKTGIIKSKKTFVKSKLGDEFVAGNIDGNIKDMVLNFTSNVSGKIIKDGKITYFKSDKAKIDFIKNKKYEVKRAKLFGNAKVEQENSVLTSDFIDIDYPNNKIYARDNSSLKIVDKENVTKVFAKVMELDNNKNIIILDKDVLIDNQNNKYDKTIVKADKGIINKNTDVLELIGNLFVENNDSTIKANRGIYDIKTRKIKVIGNVMIDYKN